jgi:hypothetical protein
MGACSNGSGSRLHRTDIVGPPSEPSTHVSPAASPPMGMAFRGRPDVRGLSEADGNGLPAFYGRQVHTHLQRRNRSCPAITGCFEKSVEAMPGRIRNPLLCRKACERLFQLLLRLRLYAWSICLRISLSEQAAIILSSSVAEL